MIPPGAREALTDRQLQVIILNELGWSQHQIARHLGISRSTVCTHIDNAATIIHQHQRKHVQDASEHDRTTKTNTESSEVTEPARSQENDT